MENETARPPLNSGEEAIYAYLEDEYGHIPSGWAAEYMKKMAKILYEAQRSARQDEKASEKREQEIFHC